MYSEAVEHVQYSIGPLRYQEAHSEGLGVLVLFCVLILHTLILSSDVVSVERYEWANMQPGTHTYTEGYLGIDMKHDHKASVHHSEEQVVKKVHLGETGALEPAFMKHLMGCAPRSPHSPSPAPSRG